MLSIKCRPTGPMKVQGEPCKKYHNCQVSACFRNCSGGFKVTLDLKKWGSVKREISKLMNILFFKMFKTFYEREWIGDHADTPQAVYSFRSKSVEDDTWFTWWLYYRYYTFSHLSKWVGASRIAHWYSTFTNTAFDWMEYIIFNTNAVQIHYSLPFKGSCHVAGGDTALIIRHSRSSSFKKTSLGQPTRMSGASDDLVWLMVLGMYLRSMANMVK